MPYRRAREENLELLSVSRGGTDHVPVSGQCPDGAARLLMMSGFLSHLSAWDLESKGPAVGPPSHLSPLGTETREGSRQLGVTSA